MSSKLNSRQQKAIPLLAAGLNDNDVAEEVGVTRQTVSKWKNQHQGFMLQLEHYRTQIWQIYIDKYRSLIPEAINVLQDLLHDENPRVRLDAAKEILKNIDLSLKSESEDYDSAHY